MINISEKNKPQGKQVSYKCSPLISLPKLLYSRASDLKNNTL